MKRNRSKLLICNEYKSIIESHNYEIYLLQKLLIQQHVFSENDFENDIEISIDFMGLVSSTLKKETLMPIYETHQINKIMIEQNAYEKKYLETCKEYNKYVHPEIFFQFPYQDQEYKRKNKMEIKQISELSSKL